MRRGGCGQANGGSPGRARRLPPHLLWSRMSCAESNRRKSGKATGARLLGSLLSPWLLLWLGAAIARGLWREERAVAAAAAAGV